MSMLNNHIGVSRWQVSAPAPDPFGAVVGDTTEYVTHLLTVGECDDTFLRDQIGEFVFETFRYANATYRKETSLMSFLWDPVYSTLTVTGSDAERSYDDTHVFKIIILPWDEAARDSRRKQGDFESDIERLIAETFGRSSFTSTIDELLSRGIRFEFSSRSDGNGDWRPIKPEAEAADDRFATDSELESGGNAEASSGFGVESFISKVRERHAELESRGVPQRASRVPDIQAKFPTPESLGEGWSEIKTYVTDERLMARLDQVRIEKTYSHPAIPARPNSGEPAGSLKVSAQIFDEEEEPVQVIQGFADDHEEKKEYGDWNSVFYGSPWENCIAYPRTHSNFSDMIVQFAHERCLWTVHCDSHHAIWIARALHCNLSGQEMDLTDDVFYEPLPE